MLPLLSFPQGICVFAAANTLEAPQQKSDVHLHPKGMPVPKEHYGGPVREQATEVTLVTLALDPDSQAHFEAMRQQYFPPALNCIAAHLTLFHALPASQAVQAVLQQEAAALRPFPLEVSSVRTLGRGVAYFLESPELKALHRRLAQSFQDQLSPQDRQGFRPHVVVQNKVNPAEAKALHAVLSAGFKHWQVQAHALEWWNYLGGPWELRERLRFASA